MHGRPLSRKGAVMPNTLHGQDCQKLSDGSHLGPTLTKLTLKDAFIPLQESSVTQLELNTLQDARNLLGAQIPATPEEPHLQPKRLLQVALMTGRVGFTDYLMRHGRQVGIPLFFLCQIDECRNRLRRPCKSRSPLVPA